METFGDDGWNAFDLVEVGKLFEKLIPMIASVDANGKFDPSKMNPSWCLQCAKLGKLPFLLDFVSQTLSHNAFGW